eukprot:Nk52_evm64s221 gene=Nk52_evmTU64s221
MELYSKPQPSLEKEASLLRKTGKETCGASEDHSRRGWVDFGDLNYSSDEQELDILGSGGESRKQKKLLTTVQEIASLYTSTGRKQENDQFLSGVLSRIEYFKEQEIFENSNRLTSDLQRFNEWSDSRGYLNMGKKEVPMPNNESKMMGSNDKAYEMQDETRGSFSVPLVEIKERDIGQENVREANPEIVMARGGVRRTKVMVAKKKGRWTNIGRGRSNGPGSESDLGSDSGHGSNSDLEQTKKNERRRTVMRNKQVKVELASETESKNAKYDRKVVVKKSAQPDRKHSMRLDGKNRPQNVLIDKRKNARDDEVLCKKPLPINSEKNQDEKQESVQDDKKDVQNSGKENVKVSMKKSVQSDEKNSAQNTDVVDKRKNVGEDGVSLSEKKPLLSDLKKDISEAQQQVSEVTLLEGGESESDGPEEETLTQKLRGMVGVVNTVDGTMSGEVPYQQKVLVPFVFKMLLNLEDVARTYCTRIERFSDDFEPALVIGGLQTNVRLAVEAIEQQISDFRSKSFFEIKVILDLPYLNYCSFKGTFADVSQKTRTKISKSRVLHNSEQINVVCDTSDILLIRGSGRACEKAVLLLESELERFQVESTCFSITAPDAVMGLLKRDLIDFWLNNGVTIISTRSSSGTKRPSKRPLMEFCGPLRKVTQAYRQFSDMFLKAWEELNKKKMTLVRPGNTKPLSVLSNFNFDGSGEESAKNLGVAMRAMSLFRDSDVDGNSYMDVKVTKASIHEEPNAKVNLKGENITGGKKANPFSEILIPSTTTKEVPFKLVLPSETDIEHLKGNVGPKEVILLKQKKSSKIYQSLRKAQPLSEIRSKCISGCVDAEEIVVTIPVDSRGRLWVANSDALSTMRDSVSQSCRNSSRLSNKPEEGGVFGVYCHHQRAWQRALVVEDISDFEFLVFFCDSGIESIVSWADMRQLPDSISAQAHLAHRVTLNHVVPRNGDEVSSEFPTQCVDFINQKLKSASAVFAHKGWKAPDVEGVELFACADSKIWDVGMSAFVSYFEDISIKPEEACVARAKFNPEGEFEKQKLFIVDELIEAQEVLCELMAFSSVKDTIYSMGKDIRMRLLGVGSSNYMYVRLLGGHDDDPVKDFEFPERYQVSKFFIPSYVTDSKNSFGTIFLPKHSIVGAFHVDLKTWERALVLSVSPKAGCVVLFIDLGQVCAIKSSQYLRKLPEKAMKNIPINCMLIALSGIRSVELEIGDVRIDEVELMFGRDPVFGSIEFTKKCVPVMEVYMIIDNYRTALRNHDISTLFMEEETVDFCLSLSSPMCVGPGEMFRGLVTHVDIVEEKMYYQLLYPINKLETFTPCGIMKNLNQRRASMPRINGNPKSGIVYVVRSPLDGKYYRTILQRKIDNLGKFRMRTIDFGFNLNVTLNEIFECDLELQEEGSKAFCVSVNNLNELYEKHFVRQDNAAKGDNAKEREDALCAVFCSLLYTVVDCLKDKCEIATGVTIKNVLLVPGLRNG